MTWQPPAPILKLQERVSALILDGKQNQADAIMAEACLAKPYGLYVLLRYGLGRHDAANQWVFDRCYEVQASPDGHLDLWSREHYKSTVITFAKTIQDILANPEMTVGIFSHTRPIAKAFLRQIKQEFETNERLKRWFSDVLWANPTVQSPKWSEDEGIVVKRKSNPKEATIEAWGLVDGQPTSKHFELLVYDDVVTEHSVGTPEMMQKTTKALQNSYNLGKRGGARRFIGTRYHFNDSYAEVMARKTAQPRIYAATVDGTVEGEPVFLTRAELAKKRVDQGPYVFGCQMLQNPTADQTQGFKEEWLQYAAVSHRGHNMVIVVDAASSKKKGSDYTAMWCLGLGPDRKVYVHDMLRDRLSLTERAAVLMAWHRKWQPMAVGYERYGMMADIEHNKDLQERENYRFDITEVGGQMAKNDRIRQLIPWFEQGRIYLHPAMQKTDYEGRLIDLTKSFINEEYRAFPVAQHDDMLDALARFLDPDLTIEFPASVVEEFDDRELEFASGRNPTTGY
jgi:predicted phage terminase large subunit-like protein